MKKIFISLALLNGLSLPVCATQAIYTGFCPRPASEQISQVPGKAPIKTVNLLISGMICAACPITLKRTQVDGETAGVSFEIGEARISFNPAKTTITALRKATAEAGYPSPVKK